jgi:hypothetical protein
LFPIVTRRDAETQTEDFENPAIGSDKPGPQRTEDPRLAQLERIVKTMAEQQIQAAV